MEHRANTILTPLAGTVVLAAMLGGCGSGTHATTVAVTSGSPKLFATTYRVPSGSMEPTLPLGSRVQVEPGALAVGAIVLVHPPLGAVQGLCGDRPAGIGSRAACSQTGVADANIRLVKRIVAGPGDTLAIVAGHVIRNGKREPDSYTRPCGAGGEPYARRVAESSECNFPVSIKVPAGEWYLLGDNRGESDDSRFWGPVPTASIVGVVHVPGK